MIIQHHCSRNFLLRRRALGSFFQVREFFVKCQEKNPLQNKVQCSFPPISRNFHDYNFNINKTLQFIKVHSPGSIDANGLNIKTLQICQALGTFLYNPNAYYFAEINQIPSKFVDNWIDYNILQTHSGVMAFFRLEISSNLKEFFTRKSQIRIHT